MEMFKALKMVYRLRTASSFKLSEPGNGFLDSNDLNVLNKRSDQTSGEIERCKLL
jgi:hypothetical protein